MHVLRLLEFGVSAEVWEPWRVVEPSWWLGEPSWDPEGRFQGGSHCGDVFLLPASHYYKFKQQFIFPGESGAEPLRVEWMEVHVGVDEPREGGVTRCQGNGWTRKWKRKVWGVPRAQWPQ